MFVRSSAGIAGAAAIMAVLGLCVVPGAGAQNARTAEATSDVLEEVTVTARKREEDLQQVPIAITAITAEEIRQKTIERPYDVMFSSPGVDMRAGNGDRAQTASTAA